MVTTSFIAVPKIEQVKQACERHCKAQRISPPRSGERSHHQHPQVISLTVTHGRSHSHSSMRSFPFSHKCGSCIGQPFPSGRR